MSDNPVHYETQHERWLKYGANVIVVSLLVVVLAVLVIWLSQRYDARYDTTTAGLFSLKPQTINIIKGNKSPIKLVCLYTEPQFPPGTPEAEKFDYRQPVIDLLQEYARKGSHISVEVIDPDKQENKVNDLIEEVTNKYGGEIKQYKAIIKDYPAVYDEISKLAAAEVERVKVLPTDQVKDDDLAQSLNLAFITIQAVPKAMQQTRDGIDQMLKQRPPDYKGAVDQIRSGTSTLSQMLGAIVESFTKLKDDKKVPDAFRKYMSESLPRYQAIKKHADDLEARIKKLGDLKLEDLRQSLRTRDAIIVMGEKELRTIPFDKVWVVPDDVRGYTADGKPKPRFAAERQVTSAILSLTAKSKPKVVFVRAGGPALTTPGIPGFQQGGPFSEIARRLRDYNFDVMEKDLTGMSAMQRRQMGPPEPTDEQIKDAVWIVVGLPAGRSQFGPPPSIAPKVKEHLDQGGSALIMSEPESDNFAQALDPWGIKLRTDVVAVHKPVLGGPQSNDVIQQAQRNPIIFILHNYGDSAITRPLQSLEGILLPITVVQTHKAADHTVTPIIPVPQSMDVWGETNLEALQKGDVAYNKDSDLPPPLFGGAISEKAGGGRVVVLGSAQFAMDGILDFYDPNLAKQRIFVSQFPANGELFMNSVFWLAKQDTMISISSSALEVNRIAPISSPALNAWRFGVLLIGLPGLVVLGGIWMFFARRD